jgi:dihydroorotase
MNPMNTTLAGEQANLDCDDIVIRNGRVFSFDQDEPVTADVLICEGMVAGIGKGLSAAKVLDADGYIITPALIDAHTHIYWGATSLGVAHAEMAQTSAVGTFVDAGSAGGGTIDGFDAFISRPSNQNIFAFLNISFAGIFGFSRNVMVGEAENLKLLNRDDCIDAVRRHPRLIVGIKVRAGKLAAGENGAKALEIALEVAEEVSLPVMCHVDFSPPEVADILSVLRPGDILTHCCRPAPNAIVEQGAVMQAAWQARERGVYFDTGHGMGGFSFSVCRQMLSEGFVPDIISSDVHCLSVHGPAIDLLTTVNKLIALGLPTEQALRCATWTPAKSIRRPELGRIRIGDTANISVLRPSGTSQIYRDALGEEMRVCKTLAPAALISKGRLVFSANQINSAEDQ